MIGACTCTGRRGFTLIEILIVVVIIGILAAIVIPKYVDATENTDESVARRQLQTLRNQVELYMFKESSVPADWNAMVTASYLQSVPTQDGFVFVLNDTTGDVSAWTDPNGDGNPADGADTGW